MTQSIVYFTFFLIMCFYCSALAQSVNDCTFYQNKNVPQKSLALLNKIKGTRYSCKDGKYSYSFGVCIKADAGRKGSSDSGIPFEYAGAIQTVTTTGEQPKVLGQFVRSDYREGFDWLMLEYYDGDAYHKHCSGENRTAIVMISCSHGDTAGTFKLLEEAKNKSTNCFYLFELAIDAACADLSSGLSAGSIICIVFLCLVGVYLLFGFLYQRFMKGAQGFEQFPNYGFWRELGNLSADGCNFVFRTDPLLEPREYRGITGDNLPGNEEISRDTDRDDQLLNM